ncbi:major facilitator superfamily transporter [Rhizoctonia solani]|uniref:Major facilitator superfamily transporter n=1 Tax=Rhizoctonia solani TaxID=456999 RepID=A0A8H8NRL1_9AGAM|nr:major facilitator superfamily transporter [Rhizoctonia solani]QRW18050.1 major facilitator superfamily transporter [Rhizoctonia solani]
MASSSEKVANIAVSGAPEKSDPERTSISSDDPGLTQPLVGNEELWRGTRPHDNYEGLHRWDPTATWDQEEEKALVRKIDIRLMTWLCLMFFGLQMDRGNIGNALTDNLLADLNLTTNDYNNGTTIQLLAFLVAELPSQYMIKRLGMERWLPGLMVCWSMVSWAQAWINNRTTFYITRALIGAFEGGFIPGVILYATYWYTSKELAIRLSWFWATLNVARIATGLLASGILQMRGIRGMAGWQWMFLLEGLFTAVVGIISWYYLPSSPTRTKRGIWAKKAWFTERQEVIAINRILRNDPAKGLVQIHEPLKWNDFKNAWADPSLWGLYFIGLIAYIPQGPVTGYLNLSLKNLGFSTIESNLLGIPAAALQIITMLALSRSSDYFGDRSLHVLFGEIWSLGPLIALAYLPHHASNWSRFAISTLIGGYPYFHPIVTSWVSENSFDVKKRAVAAATYNVIVQIGSVISSQLYRKDDAPLYYRANKILFSLCIASAAVVLLQRWWLRRLNAAKERAWNKLTQEQQIEYQSDEAARERDGNPTFPQISHLVARTRRKAPALELETLAPCEMNIKHEVDRSNPPGPVISKYFSMKGAERLDQPRLDERDIGVSVLATRSGTRESRVDPKVRLNEEPVHSPRVATRSALVDELNKVDPEWVSKKHRRAAAGEKSESNESVVKQPRPKKRRLKRGYAPPDVYAHLNYVQDCLDYDLNILFCGINPGQKSAGEGHHFANPLNGFWRCLHQGGLTDALIPPSEDHTLPERFRLGIVNQTNLVDRPSAEMMELSMAERRAAVPGFLQKVHKWRPKIVCMVGKGIWEDVFAYIAKASKGKGDTGGIIVERCPNRAGHRGWDELKAGFEFDVQPVCLLHNLPETEGGSKDDDQCMPVGIKRTLFFVVPSTSTRVRAYQLADKITLFQLLRKRWEELEAGAMTKSVEWQIRVSDTVKLPLTYPTTDHPPWIEPPPYPRFNMNSPTKFAPRTAAPRPPLPSHAFNPLIASMDKAEPAPVKFQVITREGQDIIVGRVKIPTPNGNHAFILRRFDTGAISLSTMFRAAFPTAGDEAEKVDSNWVKTNYDLTGANGGGKLRLAGTWVPPALAVHLASSYSLAQVIYPLAEAQPDATASYRKSSRHTTNGPVNTNMGALSTPLKTTRATNPTDSPSTHPSKRTKRESASPARARIAPVSPLKQTPLPL